MALRPWSAVLVLSSGSLLILLGWTLGPLTAGELEPASPSTSITTSTPPPSATATESTSWLPSWMGELLVVLGFMIAVVGVFYARQQVQGQRVANQQAAEQRRRDDPDYQAQALRDLKRHREQFPMEFRRLLALLDDLEAIREGLPVPLPSSRELRLASGAFGARQGDFDAYQRTCDQFFSQLNSTISEIDAARSAVTFIRHPSALPLSVRLLGIGDALRTIETDIHIPMQQVRGVLNLVQRLAFELNEIRLGD